MTSTTAVATIVNTITITGIATQPDDELSSVTSSVTLDPEAFASDVFSVVPFDPVVVLPLPAVPSPSVSSSVTESWRPSIVLSLSSLSTALLYSQVVSMIFFLYVFSVLKRSQNEHS